MSLLLRGAGNAGQLAIQSNDLPTGALGVWIASDYVANPRPYIPNRIASGGIPVNLLNGSRRQLGSNAFWPSRNSVTVTDDAVNDPDGRLTAATAVASGTGWVISRTVTLPAGTYTIGVNARRNGASDETFRFLLPTPNPTLIYTATSTWQRFSCTFTTTGSAVQIGLLNNTTQASLQIANLELYQGAVDLGPEPVEVGHMYLDPSRHQALHSYASGVLNLRATGSFGYIQFPNNLNPTNSTVVGVVRKESSGTGYVSLMSRVQNWQHFAAHVEDNSLLQFKVGNNMSTNAQQYASGWNLNGKGWSSYAFRCDGNTRDIWLDEGRMLQSTNAISATSARDFFVSTIIDGTYGGGHDWAALAYWNRSLSDSELITAKQNLMSQVGLSRGSKRMLFAVGDSITNGSSAYPALYLSNDSPEVLLMVYSIVGGTLSQVTPLVGESIPVNKVSGSKYIVSIMVTNGLTDPISSYLDTLQAVCVSLRNRGAIVVLCTLPPRADAAHNVRRNAVNSTIRTWVGTFCDVICDFAADPTYGTDAAGSNTSFYPDGVHPTNTLQSVWLEPMYRAVINAL